MVPPIPSSTLRLRLATCYSPQHPTTSQSAQHPASPPSQQHDPLPSFSKLQVSLLDLPDEALAHIITAISPDVPVRRHDIEFGPDSCDLAITCRRLFHLFRTQTLTKLDALYPESFTQTRPRAPDGQLTSQHLAALVRLAGSVLRVLRLPFDDISPTDVLTELALRRIHLEELVYRNVPPVPESAENLLFAHAAAQLKVLTVHNPTSVLKYIHKASNIEQLELTGIHPHLIYQLGILLSELSRTLRVLRVGFDSSAPTQVDMSADAATVAVRCIKTFAEFIGLFVSGSLSNLRTLNVSAEPSPIVFHDQQADDQHGELHPIARGLERKINGLREINATVFAPTQLRHLVLRCISAPVIANMLKCIDGFYKIISPSITVELQAISFSIVFPHDVTPPYFRALQMTNEEVRVFENDIDIDYNRMEVLDIGSPNFVSMYSGSEEIRRTVMDIVWQAEDSLSTVIMDAEVKTSLMMKRVCSYVGDVLEITPNVETVCLRAEVVDFIDKGCFEFQRMMTMMRSIKVLRLTTVQKKTADCKLAFGRRFPLFLKAVARSCPNLECLFLESAPPIRPQSIASLEIFQLAITSHELCMEALENLEALLPNCDVTSVRSQLNVWYTGLSALKGLLSCSASASGDDGSGAAS